MSLILEALKKSEAKRRLGEAPDIGTPFTTARRRRNPLPLIIVALLVIGGIVWWFLRDFDHTPAAPTNAATGTVQPSGQFANVNPGSTTPTTPTIAAQPPRPMADRIAHLPMAPKMPVAPLPSTSTQPAKVTTTTEVPSHATTPSTPTASTTPASVPKPAAKDVAAADAKSNASDHAGQKSFPPPEPTAPAAMSPPKDAPTANTATPATATPDAPMYYELSYNIRKDLPAIVLSMHVYAADPAQRFVVINGDRYAEGDTVKDDLTLKQILPDGVLLEFRGQRFLYPRSSR